MLSSRSIGQTLPETIMHALLNARVAIGLLAGSSALLLAGAWYSEIVAGLLPCKLCLQQRWPHYLAVVLGTGLLARVSLASGVEKNSLERSGVVRLGLWVLALVFAVSAGMGGYHAGVEWGWFAGPNDCGGTAPAAASSMQDFMRQLQTTRVVSCTDAAWRLLGLSLAGWNGVISAGLAGFAAISALRS